MCLAKVTLTLPSTTLWIFWPVATFLALNTNLHFFGAWENSTPTTTQSWSGTKFIRYFTLFFLFWADLIFTEPWQEQSHFAKTDETKSELLLNARCSVWRHCNTAHHPVKTAAPLSNLVLVLPSCGTAFLLQGQGRLLELIRRWKGPDTEPFEKKSCWKLSEKNLENHGKMTTERFKTKHIQAGPSQSPNIIWGETWKLLLTNTLHLINPLSWTRFCKEEWAKISVSRSAKRLETHFASHTFQFFSLKKKNSFDFSIFNPLHNCVPLGCLDIE